MTADRAFTVFKYAIYALLAANVYLFFRHTTFHEGLDCVGWVLLLAVFEWETRTEKSTPSSRAGKIILLAGQALAYALIFYAWGNYYAHAQWLDFINASLWLGVVAMITADVYSKRGKQWRGRWLHHAVKFLFYAGLIAIAIVWGMQGDILNFYDAFLWIVCFFAIELNLLKHVRHAWRKRRDGQVA